MAKTVKKNNGKLTKRGRPKGSLGKKLRPTSYTDDLARMICMFIALGNPLTRICKLRIKNEHTYEAMKLMGYVGTFEDFQKEFPTAGIPSYQIIMTWLWKPSPYREKFLEDYKLARDQQADYIADETIDIADDATNDYFDVVDPKTGLIKKVLDKEHMMRSRLRVETRKWVASKFKPRKYGEGLTKLEVTGKDGEAFSLGPQPSPVIIFEFNDDKNDNLLEAPDAK